MIHILIDIKLSCHQGKNVQSCVNSESLLRHWVCPKLAPVFPVKNRFCQISIPGIFLIMYLCNELLQMPQMNISAFVAVFDFWLLRKLCC